MVKVTPNVSSDVYSFFSFGQRGMLSRQGQDAEGVEGVGNEARDVPILS